MNPHERKGTDRDEHEPADTIVLDDDAIMETAEFEKLLELNDPSRIEEIEPPEDP